MEILSVLWHKAQQNIPILTILNIRLISAQIHEHPFTNDAFKINCSNRIPTIIFHKVVEMNPAEAMAANLARLSYSATLRVC